MPFTATCRFSGTAWDGPSGCPIVSPSNWDTYVRNNTCILAIHNHSGSLGEGQVLPGSWFPAIDSDHFSAFFPVASTNWNRGGDANLMLVGALKTATQNAIASYDVYLRDGTYRLRVITGCGPNFAILTACINGSQIATIDCYRAAADVDNNNASVSFTASGAGEKTLTFATDTKNASSGGYTAEITYISIVRTGN